MSGEAPKVRIAVVSPFVDKRHGTERCLAEQLKRLAEDYEIHLFSSRVEDVDLSRICWHRVLAIPGPHLVQYLWWFAANHIWRWSERRRSGRAFDLVYSPGINCLDADVILIHSLFAEQLELPAPELRLRSQRLRAWARLAHRRLFYRLIARLECAVYSNPEVSLAAISREMAAELGRRFQRIDRLPTIYHGTDGAVFDPCRREQRRRVERRKLGFAEKDLVVLLIANDWDKKGLACLLDALAGLRKLALRALLVGSDASRPYLERAERLGIAERLVFAAPERDVMRFFAAADIYAAPSIYDPFGLPVLEAMACGMPVIVSRTMGAAELVTHGADGLLLDDPRDAKGLALLIEKLAVESGLRQRLGRSAAETARKFTWDANAEALKRLFECALERQRRRAPACAPPQ